jgi:hypothetical protein
MLTNFQPSPEERNSDALNVHLSALYDSNAYNKKLIDRLRTFYVYAKSGKLTLSRRHGQSLTSLYFSDGTLIQIESTEPDLDISPQGIQQTLLKILGWKDAQLEWTADLSPEERPLAVEINLLFAEIDHIRQSKRTKNWGSRTCRMMVDAKGGKARLPMNLEVLGKEGGRYQFTLVSERTLIGRDANLVDIAIPSPSLSRKHALLQVIETGIFIQDLDTRNGTYLNDHPLKPNLFYPVEEKDEIYMADCRIILEPTPELVAGALKVKAESQMRRLKRHIQSWNLDEE